MKIKIGVLAVQGAFSEHVESLQKLNKVKPNLDLEVREVRSSGDLSEDSVAETDNNELYFLASSS